MGSEMVEKETDVFRSVQNISVQVDIGVAYIWSDLFINQPSGLEGLC